MAGQPAPTIILKKTFMNKFKLPAFGFALVLLITSCKKEDVQPTKPSVNTATTAQALNSSEWRSLTNWSTLKGEKTSYFSKVSDSAITTEVAQAGLVLAFAKDNNGIQSLPLSEKDNSYWYYQVSRGSISFSTDATDTGAKQFSYFIFSKQQLAELDASGYSKSKLMQMSYNDLAGLLKK